MRVELTFSLYMAFKKMQIEYHRQAKQNGLAAAPYAALQKLWEQEGLTITDLGDKLFLKNSSITSLMDRMERDGLVYRERTKDDRRVVRIYLTDKARRLKEVIPNFEEHLLKKLKDSFAPEEIAALIGLLNKMEESL
jgi:DNA-binding MarR family transcriptional regulator